MSDQEWYLSSCLISRNFSQNFRESKILNQIFCTGSIIALTLNILLFPYSVNWILDHGHPEIVNGSTGKTINENTSRLSKKSRKYFFSPLFSNNFKMKSFSRKIIRLENFLNKKNGLRHTYSYTFSKFSYICEDWRNLGLPLLFVNGIFISFESK